MAIDSGLPVVPVSIAGSRHVMLKGRLMTCPGDVTITVHEPIPTVGVGREGARALAEQVRNGGRSRRQLVAGPEVRGDLRWSGAI